MPLAIEAVLVGDVTGDHHLAASHEVDDSAETIEGGAGLSFCSFVRGVPGMDPVHKELLILRFVRKLSAVLAAHIFAESAQPHRFIFEVFFLFWCEVAAVEVMLPPRQVIPECSIRGSLL